MNREEHLLLWNQAFIQVMDVRRTRMSPGTALRGYRLPASAFLYTVGSALVRMDGIPYATERFHLFHGGKGLCLDIDAEEAFEYMLILYKASSASNRLSAGKLPETNNPFLAQYGFAPGSPVLLLDLAERLHQAWERRGQLDKLHVKSLFYQFVHELQRQMEDAPVEAVRPDPVAQAVSYMQRYYSRPLTLEGLASMVDCHPRQLLRAFKSRYQTSPIDYLTRIRIARAKQLLLESSCTLYEIAESVGYSDGYYFSRVFKKTEGVSPIRFKEQAHKNRPKSTSFLSASSIAASQDDRYIDIEFENHYQYINEGEWTMRRKTGKQAALTLLFCLALLLSACSNGTVNPNAGSRAGQGKQIEAGAETNTSTQTEAKRVIKHAMGETPLTGTPKWVVILTNEGTEALLAVGIKPVGAVQSWLGSPWYDHIKDEMGEVEVVGDELQPNIERIAALKPDLIIGNKVRQEKIYTQLEQIAPTIFAEDLAGDWQINFKLYAEAVNKKEEGDKAMAEFNKRVAAVKAKLGDKANTKVSVVRFSASQVRIYQKQTFSGVLLEQLGIARPASQDKDSFIEVMTKETIPAMDGDVMFYFVTETAGKTDGAKVAQEWINDPLFQNLNVAKTKKVIQVDEGIWNSAGGYKAANLLLDELTRYFEVQ